MNQATVASTTTASSPARARSVHEGRIEVWSRDPSMVREAAWGTSARTWNGRVTAGPRQKVRRGLTLIFANAAAPGAARNTGGRSSNERRRSASSALSVASSGTLPRLSSARSWPAPRLPRDVRGTSSVKTSLNGSISSVPSSTADPAGSSFEVARTPKGIAPAGTWDDRGGATTMLAVPSAPGKSDNDGGSMVVQGLASPRISRLS